MARLRRPDSDLQPWQMAPEVQLFGASNWFTLAGDNPSEFFVRTRRLTEAEWHQLRERYREALEDLRAYCNAHPDPWERAISLQQIRTWAAERGVPCASVGIDLSQLCDVAPWDTTV